MNTAIAPVGSAVGRCEPYLEEAVAYLEKRLPARPKLAFILGSGFSALSDRLFDPVAIPYRDIPGFLAPGVDGHAGCLAAGTWMGYPTVFLSGRVHLYEGYSARAITFPVRVLSALGVRTLIPTAAVGSMRRDFAPGTLVVVRGHMNFMGDNPLIGHVPGPGEIMFPDLTNAYCPDLIKRAVQLSSRSAAKFRTGIHVACSGPSYETPHEIRAFRKLGGDTVGMSLVPEVIMAARLGLRVFAVVCASNYAPGVGTGAHVTHQAVLAKIRQSAAQLELLMKFMAPSLA